MSPVQQIKHPLFHHYKLEVYIKRDDLLHTIISGNKWRKLKYNIKQAKKLNKKSILSFGGSYSNHIHALAFACYQQGIKSKAIIRGEREYANNFTLSWAKHWGMELIFVNRETYRKRQQAHYLASLQHEYAHSFIVPEGGSNSLALLGVGEICDELQQQGAHYDHLLLPVGSGGTLAGLVSADKNQHNLLGIAVLKQGNKTANYLTNEVNKLLTQSARQFTNWQIFNHYHCGGYAKFSSLDLARIQAFMVSTNIPLEPVYSGKMILALLDLIEQNYFQAHDKIMLLHTGGLQGLAGLAERNLINPLEWPLPPTPTAK